MDDGMSGREGNMGGRRFAKTERGRERHRLYKSSLLIPHSPQLRLPPPPRPTDPRAAGTGLP